MVIRTWITPTRGIYGKPLCYFALPSAKPRRNWSSNNRQPRKI